MAQVKLRVENEDLNYDIGDEVFIHGHVKHDGWTNTCEERVGQIGLVVGFEGDLIRVSFESEVGFDGEMRYIDNVYFYPDEMEHVEKDLVYDLESVELLL